MAEGNLDLMEKRRQIKQYDTLLKEIRTKCDEATEKWINNTFKNIELYHRSNDDTIYRNVEKISG